MESHQRNIPQELRNGVNDLNFAEILSVSAEVLGYSCKISEVSEKMMGANARVHPELLPTIYFLSDPTGRAQVEWGSKVVGGLSGYLGEMLRTRDEQQLSKVMNNFKMDRKIPSENGVWNIYLAQDDQENNGRFLAVYLCEGSANTLIAGKNYQEHLVDSIIDLLTKEVLEVHPSMLNWPIGPASVENAEWYGVIQGMKLATMVVLTDLGIPKLISVYPGVLYSFHQWLEDQHMPHLLVYPVLAVPLLYFFLRQSAEMGRKLGKHRDQSITARLPAGAEELSYGKSALSHFREEKSIITTTFKKIKGLFGKE